MSLRIENAEVSVGCPPPSSPERGEEWKSFQIQIHDFANLSTTKEHYVESPEFTCIGQQWVLRFYPGGNIHIEAVEGQVSTYLHHLSEGSITTRVGINIIDKFGEAKVTRTSPIKKEWIGFDANWGWINYISRSFILDESNDILDSNGTLTVVVSIEEEPTTAFVPRNPFFQMMKGLFNDETTADVCFEFSSVDEKEGEGEESKSSVSLYAHRFILEKCAPTLADICGSNDSDGIVTVSVNDIKQDIFRHLLSYVYGGSVPKEVLKTHAKDVIDAANKYSIVNLKLEAEAAYVESTKLTFDNAMDNLLYADSMNCALLKETVMTFMADNHFEAADNISFTDSPPHCASDLLIAFGRSIKKDANETNADELTTLSVSALRRKLDLLGLEVDGSREAMIEAIKKNY